MIVGGADFGQAACGWAMRSRRHIDVEDVTNSRVFSDNRMIEVMLGPAVRAVQSTPLVTGSDELLGMLSIHYRAPQKFSERLLRQLDMVAASAGKLIERWVRKQGL